MDAQNHQLTDWETFTHALEVRFRPSSYENHQVELFKLRQYSTVAEYQHRFEKLSNRVFGLNAETLLNCFPFSLSPNIR